MAVRPKAQVLTDGQSQQFAIVDDAGSPAGGAVTWTITPATAGSINPGGLYTAPAAVDKESAVIVTGTPAQDGTPQTATVRLLPSESMFVPRLTPSKVSLGEKEQQQFTVSVPGDETNNVRWQITPKLGSIDNNGLYTAPISTKAADREVQVIAISALDAKKLGTATVQLVSKFPWGVASLLMLYLVAIYSLVSFLAALWPPPNVDKIVAYLPWGKVSLAREVDLIWLVLITGALGSFVYSARSFVDFVGNRSLRVSWGAWYLLYPFIGSALALIFYLAVRGGFLTTNANSSDINVFGLVAISGMVGMFSKQATKKLGEVFSTLFKSEEDDKKLKDKVNHGQT